MISRFLQIMRRGFPEYGCVINPEKTVTNLEPHEKVFYKFYSQIIFFISNDFFSAS